MKQRVLASVFLCALAATAHAEPEVACRIPDPSTKLTVEFAAEPSIRDLAVWVTSFTCKNVVFATDVAKYATHVAVLVPRPLTPKQALQLFVDAVEATGLVVTLKADTISIKLGPGMSRSCTSVAQTASTASTAPTAPTAPLPSSTEPLPPSAEAPPPDAALSDAALDAAIRTIDATHREVTRAFVDSVLLNPMAASKGVRVVPAIAGNKPIGFRVYSIRPGGVFARLGFLNGDTITALNGYSLTSADKALEVYSMLRSSDRLEISLLRARKPMTLTITVR